jgi:hypothetical protein
VKEGDLHINLSESVRRFPAAKLQQGIRKQGLSVHVSHGVHSASRVQLRSYLIEKEAAAV